MRRALVYTAATLAILVGPHCNFNPETDEEETTAITFLDNFSLTCLAATGGATGLKSSNIKDLSTSKDSDYLWIATWGGGISRLDKSGNYTTYDGATLSSDFCSKVGGGSSRAFAACVDATQTTRIDYFTGSAWEKDGPTAQPVFAAGTTKTIASIAFNGTRFLILEDYRVSNFMDTAVAAEGDSSCPDAFGTGIQPNHQTKLYLRNTTGTESFTMDTHQEFSYYSHPDNDSATKICVNASAIAQVATDRDGDFIGIGYFSDDHVSHWHNTQAWNHLAFHRRNAVTLSYKNNGADIKPILFGKGLARQRRRLSPGYRLRRQDCDLDGFRNRILRVGL